MSEQTDKMAAAKAALEAAQAEALAVRRGEDPQPLQVLEAILNAA